MLLAGAFFLALLALPGHPALAAQSADAVPTPSLAGPAPVETVLVDKGAGRMRILVSGLATNLMADREAFDPGRDLQTLLRKISGAELELAAAQPGETGLYLGKASDFPWLGLEAEVRDLGPEGFLIRSDGSNLLLLAREDAAKALADQ